MPFDVSSQHPISVADVFTLGMGPSSSHTLGPIRAGSAFADEVANLSMVRVQGDLFGYLALTGRGYRSDAALVRGLSGLNPKPIEPGDAGQVREGIRRSRTLDLAGRRPVVSVEVEC